MTFRKDEIIIILGAGASVEANIPESRMMITRLEGLLETDDWSSYIQLYNYLKSAISYSDGIKGNFGNATYNIERLINTLDDLNRGDEHPLYPFIGAWNPRLIEVTKNQLDLLGNFREKILRELRDKWIPLENYKTASYYINLLKFAEEYQFPLRVFSLNYDLCVETACKIEEVALGFDDKRIWDWRILNDDDKMESPIRLYKLHGSIDWVRNESGQVERKDSPSHIEPSKLEIIFGTTYKLQYHDPYLFLAYELRRRSLESAKLIITVGYGFNDEHINKILGQALNYSTDKKILDVTAPKTDNENRKADIVKNLELAGPDVVTVQSIGAKDFFEEHLKIDELIELFPKEADPFS